MTIQQIINDLIDREGGYSNNPNDPGGETMYGWTAAAARAEGYTGAMKDMPRSWAEAAYLRKYVTEPGFQKIAAINMRIAEELVDTAVNCGAGVPGPWLQRSLNLFNRQGMDYADIGVDGQLGAATIAALQAFLTKRGADGEKVLLRALNSLQGYRYIDIGEHNTKLEDFEFGWFLNRIAV